MGNKFWDGKLELLERNFNLGDSLGMGFSNFKGSFKCEVIKGCLKFGVLKNLENSSRVMGNFGIQDKLGDMLLETSPVAELFGSEEILLTEANLLALHEFTNFLQSPKNVTQS